VGTPEPGADARGDNARRSVDADAHVVRERRFIGSLIVRLADEPARLHPWEQGASGERIVGARLDKIDGIEVLHDRRIPGSRANIDHIAIGPGGVYAIDAKLHGGMVRHRHVDGPRRDERHALFAGPDQTKLVTKMSAAVHAITRALCETPIPVCAAVCFVDGQWPLPPRPFMLDGVWIGRPDALPDLVARPGLLDPEAIKATSTLLDARLHNG
jgi:hypothetical protein